MTATITVGGPDRASGSAAGLLIAGWVVAAVAGIVTRSLAMFALYAAVGALLCARPISRLAR